MSTFWRANAGFVTKQYLSIRNGDDIIMEYALIDDLRVLLSEDNLLRIHLIKTRHGLAGFAALARRITSGSYFILLFAP
ncbi:Uncharacterised protein [Salmonella enterica subsp. enterica serovar Typhimurium]|nr:Uncharacterised protein [Salmonella enterica subsp. enterica serovar Typhimurium]